MRVSLPVDAAPAMYVDDACRECAHSTTKRLGVTCFEGARFPFDLLVPPWAESPTTGNLAACALHGFLRAHAFRNESAVCVLKRLPSDERARLRELGDRLTDELSTPPAKRARRV